MTQSLRRRLLVVAALVVALVVIVASPAFAHATLDETIPSPGAALAQSPKRIELRFSESVSVARDGVRLFDQSGQQMRTGVPVKPAVDTVDVAVRDNLEDGPYIVTWRVTSADGHPVQGSFTFQVGTAANANSRDVTALASKLAAGQRGEFAVGIAWGVTRWLAFASIALLVGGAIFIAVLWPPARSSRRAQRLVTAGWVGAIVSTVVGLVLQGPYDLGRGFGDVFDLDLLRDTIETRFGTVWIIRLALLLVAFVLLRALFAGPATPRAAVPSVWGVLAAAVGVGIVATPALSGHASTGDHVALAQVVDTIHVGAMAVWLGGLVLLAAAVLPTGSARDLAAALPRFSRVAFSCVVALVVTGGFQTWREVGSLEALRNSDFGRILVIKLVVFALMLVVAALSREIVVRQYQPVRFRSRIPVVSGGAYDPPPAPIGRDDRRDIDESPPNLPRGSDAERDLRDLRRSVWIEAAIGAAVLIVTALLVNAAPARGTNPEPLGPPALTLRSPRVVVDLAIVPGTQGANDLHVSTYAADGAPKDVPELALTFDLPARDIPPMTVGLRKLGFGHYLAPGFTIPYPGSWRVTAKVRLTDVDLVTLTARVTIRSP